MNITTNVAVNSNFEITGKIFSKKILPHQGEAHVITALKVALLTLSIIGIFSMIADLYLYLKTPAQNTQMTSFHSASPKKNRLFSLLGLLKSSTDGIATAAKKVPDCVRKHLFNNWPVCLSLACVSLACVSCIYFYVSAKILSFPGPETLKTCIENNMPCKKDQGPYSWFNYNLTSLVNRFSNNSFSLNQFQNVLSNLTANMPVSTRLENLRELDSSTKYDIFREVLMKCGVFFWSRT